jgi:hypothetical protein
VELEVACLGSLAEQGRWRELGFTQATGRWGSMAGGVHLPAWRVEERGERGWRRSWQDLAHAWLGSPLLLLFFQIFSNAKAGVVLGAMLVIWLGLGARF